MFVTIYWNLQVTTRLCNHVETEHHTGVFFGGFSFFFLNIFPHRRLEPRISLLVPVHGEPNVAACNSNKEQNSLEQEPAPASLSLLGLLDAAAVGVWSTARSAGRSNAIKVLRFHRDNVMVVAQFTGLAREAQVRDGRDSDVGLGCGQGKAVGPAVLRLVLQVEGQ